jgi:HEAT repeat protein
MADRWLYIHAGAAHGPVNLEKLGQLATAGKLLPTDQVWPAGEDRRLCVEAHTLLNPDSFRAVQRTVEEALASPPQAVNANPDWLSDVAMLSEPAPAAMSSDVEPVKEAPASLEPTLVPPAEPVNAAAPASADMEPGDEQPPAKIEQVKVRRVEAPAANRAPIIQTQATRKLGSLPRGVLWGSIGTAVVIVLAMLGFALFRGRTRPEPQQPDRLVKNEPEEKSAPQTAKPIDPPQSEPVKKPDKKPVAAPPEPPTVDSLVLALKNGPPPARKKALEELGRLGPQARPALATALDLVKAPDVEVRTLAQETIARMGPPTKDDVPIYAAALRDSAPEVCIVAAGQLGALGRYAQSELVFLRVLTLDMDTAIRESATAAVLRIEADLLPTLTQGLQDKSVSERCRCARELALMGANAKAALPNLVEALADGNSAVRLAARDVFVAIGPDAVMVLGEGLRDKNADVRLSAIYALGRMGPDARFVLPELIAVTYEADVRATEEALAALARIGDYAIPYVLQNLEREKNITRQKALLDALERIGHDAGPAVHKAVQNAKPEVVKLTAPVLKKLSLQPAPKSRVAHTGPVLLIQDQLLAWFVVIDINSDGFLDKQELAYAFRGPNARPYDYNPIGTAPKKIGASDFVQYADFAFLCRLDRNNDGRISRSEFEHWAYDYADFVKRDADERDRIMKARERCMERGISEAVRKHREIAVAQAWASYQEVRKTQHQTSHMEGALHKALQQKPRPKGK